MQLVLMREVMRLVAPLRVAPMAGLIPLRPVLLLKARSTERLKERLRARLKGRLKGPLKGRSKARLKARSKGRLR